ncbi:hypothetical protein ACH6EH_19865 [Paenibacillus sp. JSM ZJ436]|uniref:hypothetical protein n=1 Tax=Paenibacillus sp. JSM ZJ436 TaxID=3376190 RepID=UPI0037BBFBAD
MLSEISKEVKSKFTPMLILLWIAVMSILIGMAVYRSSSYQLRDSLELFTFTIKDILPLLFPILAVIVYVSSFSLEIDNRFLTYTRMRRPIINSLKIKLAANTILSGAFFFLIILGCFVFAYYIEPMFEIAHYDPAGFGLTEDNIAHDTYIRFTFTQVLEYGIWTYAILYSLWIGMNASLYAAIALYLVILVRNRFLALSLPFIIYIISSFTLSALGVETYRPNHVLFPFDRVQSPIWTAFVPFVILLFVLFGLVVYVKRNIAKIGSLT